MKRTVLTIILALAAFSAGAQKYTLSGYITDAASGEPLIGAAVVDITTGTGAVSNNFGFYSLTVSAGSKQLEVTQLGYKTLRDTLTLGANVSRNFKIEEDALLLEGAVVTAHRSNLGVKGTQMSAIEVPLTQIKSVPAIAGEVDLLKVLQLLPGVQSGTEGSAGFHVRGGGADENLLLLDGVPLYNVNHMGGFFSVFNADAIKNVTLYKGNFPARFGSHLSSVVDVRMNDGNYQKYHGVVSVGTVAAKVSLEGPIIKDRTSFAVSFRRTYADVLARPIIAWYNKRENDGLQATGGYYFYDFNAKVSHKMKNGDKLTLSFYSGDDDIYASVDEQDSYQYVDSENTRYQSNSANTMNLGWAWGNLVSALRWTKELAPRLFMNTGVSYTQYRHTLKLKESQSSSFFADDKLLDKCSEEAQVTFKSNIRDISATLDFEYTPSDKHDIKFGAVYTSHTFKPGISSISLKETENDVPAKPFEANFGDKNIYPHEVAVYFEDNMTIFPWLKANAGLRGSLYHVQGKTYWSAEPRLGLRALISDHLSLKASYSRMSQYVHLLSNASVSLPTDLWVPVTAAIKPMVSNQEALGIFYELGDFDFSIEGYYKSMNNVIEYRDGASFIGSSTGWEEKVAVGKGWSYGAEFMVQKSVGRTTGWIGYTISRTMRKFDREGNILNGGLPFPAKYDRTHDFNVTLTHKFSERIDVSGTFVLSTGNCGTLSYRTFNARTPGSVEPYYEEVGYIESRNNFRMPLYHRGDLGANFHFPSRHGQHTLSVSVYNFYNHQNPFIVYRTTDSKEIKEPDGSVSYKSYGVIEQVSIFPIIPSISYSFKF